jgi:hypothetical protein
MTRGGHAHAAIQGHTTPPRRRWRALGIEFGPWVPGRNRGWCSGCGALVLDHPVYPIGHPDRLRGPYG